MSSNLFVHKGQDTTKLEGDLNRQHGRLHHVTPPEDNLNLTKDRVIHEAAKGVAEHQTHLHHVNPPQEGISDRIRQAYLEEHGHGGASGRSGAGHGAASGRQETPSVTRSRTCDGCDRCKDGQCVGECQCLSRS